jgi:hypothetical protein
MVDRSFFKVTLAFFGISPALVYLVAGLQGTHGDLSAGTLVAFTTLQSRLLMSRTAGPANVTLSPEDWTLELPPLSRVSRMRRHSKSSRTTSGTPSRDISTACACRS